MTTKHGFKILVSDPVKHEVTEHHKTYTATIHRVLRHPHSPAAQILLTQVIDKDGNLFRDDGHAWVKLTDEIRAKLPREGWEGHMEFKAKLKEYHTTGTTKEGLTNLTDVTIIRYKKKRK